MVTVKKSLQVCCLILQFLVSGVLLLSPVFLLQLHPTLSMSLLSLSIFISASIGSFLGGFLSDAYGRRWVLLGTLLVIALGSGLLFFNFYAAFAFIGLGVGPANNISFVYVSEQMEKRQLCSMLMLCGWATGEMLLGAIFSQSSIANNNSRLFAMEMVGIAVVVLLLSAAFLSETQTFEAVMGNQSSSKPQRLFRFESQSIKPLLLGCSLMFTMQMFYYRTQFTLDRYGVSLELNTVIVGASEFVTNILCALTINKLNRKGSLLVLLCALLGLFVLLNLIQNKEAQTSIEGIMRVLDGFAMAILAVYIPQMFPAKERGRAVNFVMSFGVIGGGVAPLLLDNFPWWVLTLFLLLSIASTLGLSDTKDTNRIEGLIKSPSLVTETEEEEKDSQAENQ